MRRNGGARPGLFDAAYLGHRYRSEFEMTAIPSPVRRLVFPLMPLQEDLRSSPGLRRRARADRSLDPGHGKPPLGASPVTPAAPMIAPVGQRPRWIWRRRRPFVERIARSIALAVSGFVAIGTVYAAFSVSKIGGVLTALLLAVMVAVIWAEGSRIE
jgi:hypothetical protein